MVPIVYTLGALRQVLDYGVASGVLASNPAAKVKAPRRSQDQQTAPRVWAPAELTSFRDHADGDPLAAAWRLSLAGLRRSEVLGLRWSSVDYEAGTVEVKRGRVALRRGQTAADDAKSRASKRTVPVEAMHPGTMSLLRALSAAQAADRLAAGAAYEATGLVVVDALGAPVSPDGYGAAFRRLCADAGVPAVRLHAIRHTVATILHDRAVPPVAAAALLGHSLQTHLAVYVQPTQTGAASAAAVFGAALAAGE
jgi:integrase